jgi:catechol 2,3-dioxygenase-like lactoylglutathione lyase family enzyme
MAPYPRLALKGNYVDDQNKTDDQERPPLWTGHLVLYGADSHRSGAFYEKLGMRPIAVMDPFAVMELRGGTHLVVRHDPDHGHEAAAFDLMVEDLDATREAWEAMGVEVSSIDKDDRGLHRVFTVTDPDGNTIITTPTWS